MRRALGMKTEFEVVDDLVYEFIILDKCDYSHLTPTLGAEKRVYLINLADHFRPTSGKMLTLVLLRWRMRRRGWLG